jgi:hypothetical protein
MVSTVIGHSDLAELVSPDRRDLDARRAAPVMIKGSATVLRARPITPGLPFANSRTTGTSL